MIQGMGLGFSFFFGGGGVDVAVSSLEALAGSDRPQEAQGRQLGRLLEIRGCGLGFIVGNRNTIEATRLFRV